MRYTMEIKATGKLTLDAIGTLLHATMFRGKSPKREIVKISAVIALFLAFSLVWLLLFENAEFFAYMLAVAVMIIFLLVYGWFILPRIRYKALGKMKEFVNEYTFGEESFAVSGNNGEYSENTETRYSAISKVIETEKYIFIFQTPSSALVLEKSTVVGDISQIRYRLRSVQNMKYIFCLC